MGILQDHWNKVERRDWPVKPRKHLRPSEIGMPNLDRYLAMTGVEPSNEIPEKTLRIFTAGSIVEYVVMEVFAAAGILKKNQAWLNLPEGEDHLGIKGKLDATIGPVKDWAPLEYKLLTQLSDAKKTGEETVILEKALALVKGMKEEYPDGLPETIVEVKSIYGRALEDGTFEGYDHNKMQLYAYLVMSNIPQGILLYVSKDDYSVLEVPVCIDDADLRQAFFDDLKSITVHIRNNTMPPKEREIVYNRKKAAFELNWGVSRSSYLTHVYGYESSEKFEEANHQLLLNINRALRHLRTGKVKSEDLEHIAYYDLEKYVNDMEEQTDVSEVE